MDYFSVLTKEHFILIELIKSNVLSGRTFTKYDSDEYSNGWDAYVDIIKQCCMENNLQFILNSDNSVSILNCNIDERIVNIDKLSPINKFQDNCTYEIILKNVWFENTNYFLNIQVAYFRDSCDSELGCATDHKFLVAIKNKIEKICDKYKLAINADYNIDYHVFC